MQRHPIGLYPLRHHRSRGLRSQSGRLRHDSLGRSSYLESGQNHEFVRTAKESGIGFDPGQREAVPLDAGRNGQQGCDGRLSSNGPAAHMKAELVGREVAGSIGKSDNLTQMAAGAHYSPLGVNGW